MPNQSQSVSTFSMHSMHGSKMSASYHHSRQDTSSVPPFDSHTLEILNKNYLSIKAYPETAGFH